MKSLLVKFAKIILVVLFGFLGFLNTPKSIPTAFAQTCTTPAQVTNVEVSYPSCVGDQCNFTQAGCSWSAVVGAANYQVTATEVESGTVVYNQQIASTITNVSFAITQNKTYKCDVSAINSCGTAGPIGTHSLLCAADAAVTVTAAPGQPTSPPAQPGVPVVGSSLLTTALGIATIFVLAGLFVLLI